MKPIPYGRQHIDESDIEAVVETLKADYLTTGPKIQEFEEKFANYVGAKYAVAVANGTAGLHLSALALDVNGKSKVITTPITFSATANCIRYCDGHVYFADIDPNTILLDIEKVRTMLESHQRGTFDGIIPVDMAGYPTNMEEYRKLADEHGLWIIEDACHAPGGWFTDSIGVKQMCGNGKYADLTIFSFHPVKHITSGEGGMITTNNAKLYECLKKLRTHGITKNCDELHENHGGWYYEIHNLGYNYRLTDIQCALGITQLAKADAGMKRRREIAMQYEEAFTDFPVKTILPPEDVGHAYHLSVIQVEDRKDLYTHLQMNGIYAQVHYIPVHTMPYYRELGNYQGYLPNSENYYTQCLSLPMYPSLEEKEQWHVINTIHEYYT